MSALIDVLVPEGGAFRSAIRKRLLTPRAPSHLARRFRALDADGTAHLEQSAPRIEFNTPRGERIRDWGAFQPGDFDMVVLCHASFIRSQRILNRLKWLVSQQCQCERALAQAESRCPLRFL